MESQQGAAGAHDACKQYQGAYPPQRVEAKDEGECHHCSRRAPYGSCVGGDFPPVVEYGAYYLYRYSRRQHSPHEVGHVQARHYVEAQQIARYGYYVGHHALLSLQHLQERPALVVAIQANEQLRHDNGKEPHHQRNRYLVHQGHQTEIAEQEEGYQSHDGQEERCKHQAYGPCRKEQGVFFPLYYVVLRLRSLQNYKIIMNYEL